MTNQPEPAPAVWIDGDPLMEAIAAAVWEQCRTEHPSSVVDDPRNIAAVAAAVARANAPAVQAPVTDQTALRNRIAAAIRSLNEGGTLADLDEEADVLALTDAVLAVLPASADRAAVLREAADFLRDAYFQDGLSVQEIGTALRRMAESVPAVAGPMGDETPEDPARIDRLRPEFFEHASVESIDVQIRRAQTQQHQCGNRVKTLTILRQARVMQKELGEWPAGGAPQPKETR